MWAAELAAHVSTGLAKVAPMAEPGTLDILTQAEKNKLLGK